MYTYIHIHTKRSHGLLSFSVCRPAYESGVITADKKNYLCQSVVWIGCFIVIVSGQFNPKEPQVSAGTAVKHSELQVLILQTRKIHTWLIP